MEIIKINFNTYRRHLILLIKIVIPITIFSFIINKIPANELKEFYSASIIISILAGTGLFTIANLVGAWRWKIVSEYHDIRLPLYWYVRTCLEGVALSLILPSSVGGDMWRIGRQTYMHKKIIVALQTIFIDRVSGLLAATIICIISLFFCYMAFSPNIRDQMTILFSVAFILILLSIVLLRHIRSLSWLLRPLERNIELLQKSVNFITDYKKVFVVLIMAILIQASAICVLFTQVAPFGAELTITEGAFTVMFAVLASTIPITLGGWGIREGTLIMALTAFGIPGSTAIKISLMFGIALLLSAIPGAVLFFFLSKHDTKIEYKSISHE